ncbi:hypothetical protein X798_03125 [Onchocerca flexuosa]|uniref:Protein quiver n=1 Tax=Onchocerca flexuosa TaxID=387005 RepID=A0A238BWS5_9BILA|nr:hypothetical protein X798_03125 [Onchocerca flexuosa]
MCLHSVTISISFSMLLYIGISDTTILPDYMATFLGQKNADGRNLGFAKPFHLPYFDDFNIDIPSSNNIHSRFHISGNFFDSVILNENSSICSLTSVSDTARCFSCMSRLYEAVWPALSSIYKKPKNFTDLCNDNDLDPQYVPFTYCPTICIRMWEEPTVAGQKFECFRKRELFKLPTELSDDSYITVCTCYADYCNGRSSAGTTERGASHCPFFLVLLCSFIVLFFIQRISWSVCIFVYRISFL